MTELTKSERMIISKYDLYFEGRLSKLEALTEEMRKDVNDIKTDFKDIRREMRRDFLWLLGAMFLISGTLGTIMAHGFKWF